MAADEEIDFLGQHAGVVSSVMRGLYRAGRKSI